MFKIALDAGHGLYTPGKRCLRALDSDETREWVLNSRICDKIAEKLKKYTGYILYRVDDVTGNKDIPLKERVDKANINECDFYLSVHHDAGVAGGAGGGMSSIAYIKASKESLLYQKIIYDEFIKETGLSGNRSTPMPLKNLYVLRESKMPAVLIECGFMDSKTDVPRILSEDFVEKAAMGIVNALAAIGGLNKAGGENMTLDEAKKVLKINAGLEDKTIEFLLCYKFGAELVTKIAKAIEAGGQ